MPWLIQKDEDHVCPEDGSHHPIVYVCGDPSCDCVWDYDNGEPYTCKECHVCRRGWPCDTYLEQEADRKRQKIIDASLSKLETVGEPYIHKEWFAKGRTCILASQFEGSQLSFDGLYDWVTIFWEWGEGLSPSHRCVLLHPE